MTAVTVFVLIGLCAPLIQQCYTQKLTFPSVLTYEKKENHVGNWSVEGNVKLSETDRIMFETSLKVQTCSTMCNIDISKCQPEAEIVPSSTTCYCIKTSNDEVKVHIGSRARPADSEQMLQAVIPSKLGFQPITAFHVIGKIPSLADSIVSFVKTPEDIQVGLTRSMTLRCDVIQSGAKLKSLKSLVIVRDGSEHIAKVTKVDAPKALTDFTNLQIKGNISENTDELGFIELVWEFPSEKQIGMYTCSVDAVDDGGHDVTLSSLLEVGVSAPTMDQLVKRIRELENKNKLTEESTKTQINQIKESTRNSLAKIEIEKNTTKAQNTEILKDLATLQRQVTQSLSTKHLETGSGHCENSTMWTHKTTGHHTAIDHPVSIKFKKPYTQPPHVMQAIYSLDIDHTKNTRAAVYINNIDRYGFTAHCHTWQDTHVYGFSFTWISFPSDAQIY